jgi:hypothetical protein
MIVMALARLVPDSDGVADRQFSAMRYRIVSVRLD